MLPKLFDITTFDKFLSYLMVRVLSFSRGGLMVKDPISGRSSSEGLYLLRA